MLLPAKIDQLSVISGRIMDPIIQFLLRDIARRIAEAGKITSTAGYQIWKTQQLGMSRREIKKELAKMYKATESEIDTLFRESAREGYDFDLSKLPTTEAVPFEKNLSLRQLVVTAAELAKDNFSSLTQTIGMIDPYGNALPLYNAYNSCCDYVFLLVSSGATDYKTAVRGACKNLYDKGLVTIDYESGKHASIETAVRRNIMGGLGLMQEKISESNHERYGADGWEISAHAASAPDHEPIQGKQYRDEEYRELNDSLVRRIGTLNCGHAAFPIFYGVTKPTYTDAELEAFKKSNADGITYQGKHYTMYEATQMQRRLETAIRKCKRKISVLEGAGDEDKLKVSRIKYTRLNQEYARFSKAAGLRMQTDRLHTSGFSYKQGTKASSIGGDQIAKIELYKAQMHAAGFEVSGVDNFTGDTRVLEKISAVSMRMAEIYPEETNGMKVVLSRIKNRDVYGYFLPDKREIHFNKNKFGNWDALMSDYSDDVKRGHFPEGTDANGLFYHEFGHAIAMAGGAKNYKKDIGEVLFECGYSEHMSVQRLNLALEKELSHYATTVTNPAYQEVVAEACSEWYNSKKPRRFCEKFLRKVGLIQ